MDIVSPADYDGDGKTDLAVVRAEPSNSPLVISSITLNFNANRGQSSPPDQTFAITNTGTDTLNWTASESIPWLNLSATSGTTPSTVTVSIDSSGLAEGNYTGEIQITAGNQTETITVSLTVEPNTTPVNHQLYLPLVTW